MVFVPIRIEGVGRRTTTRFRKENFGVRLFLAAFIRPCLIQAKKADHRPLAAVWRPFPWGQSHVVMKPPAIEAGLGREVIALHHVATHFVKLQQLRFGFDPSSIHPQVKAFGKRDDRTDNGECFPDSCVRLTND